MRLSSTHSLIASLGIFALPTNLVSAAHPPPPPQSKPLSTILNGEFRWTVSQPVLSPVARPDDPCYSVKDPSIVRYDGQWHLFMTIRSQKRSHQIEYVSFKDWPKASTAPRHILNISTGYFCAPQVFYFAPQKKWYLIHQVVESSRKVALQPAFATSTNIADPKSWSQPVLLFDEHPSNVAGWIDFWVICDSAKAHLFFTSNNGLMWRSETSLLDFPKKWTQPEIVLRGDIFEASHTYRLHGWEKYLTVIEAQTKEGRRYYKAYLADRLEGEWKPGAETLEKAFASAKNTQDIGPHWTDSFSHGELLRAGYDEKLEVDPGDLQFLFQGVSDLQRAGKRYGEIPWRLGLLKPLEN